MQSTELSLSRVFDILCGKHGVVYKDWQCHLEWRKIFSMLYFSMFMCFEYCYVSRHYNTQTRYLCSERANFLRRLTGKDCSRQGHAHFL